MKENEFYIQILKITFTTNSNLGQFYSTDKRTIMKVTQKLSLELHQ